MSRCVLESAQYCLCLVSRALKELSEFEDVTAHATTELSVSRDPAPKGHHPFPTVSLPHSPFTTPACVAKKLDHILLRQAESLPRLEPTKGMSVVAHWRRVHVEKVRETLVCPAWIDFLDVWSPKSTQSLIERFMCTALRRQPRDRPHVITYSDHVGVAVLLNLKTDSTSTPSKIPSGVPATISFQEELLSRLARGREQAQRDAIVHASASGALFGALLFRSKRWRTGRLVILAAYAVESSLAVHSFR
jgi:hypothetical protein